MARERWKRRLWIFDGHNAIFALPAFASLQREGRRQEAREQFERLLVPFAARLDQPLIIVYDGNELLPNPEAGEFVGIRTIFSQPPEVADDRIAYLVERAWSQGEPVALVSNDLRLRDRLPDGLRVMAVEEFYEMEHAATYAGGTVPAAVVWKAADMAETALDRLEARRRGLKSSASRICTTTVITGGTIVRSAGRSSHDESASLRWSESRRRGPRTASRVTLDRVERPPSTAGSKRCPLLRSP